MDDHEDAHQERTREQRRTRTRESVPPALDRLDRLGRRLATIGAQRLFLGLDFDGTLAPHVDDPSAATPTAENRRVVEALSRRNGVDIAVVSGRALDDVRTRVGIADIGYAGNHGLELEGASPLSDPDATRSMIQSVCERLEARLADCEIQDKRITATVHYRTVDRENIESRVRSVVEAVVEDIENASDDSTGLRWTPGRNIVEIRPAIDWDKGDAVERFVRRCPEECLPMYVGDDTTDEDVFRAIEPEGIGVHVGSDETAADYRVAGVEEVTTLLGWLADTGLEELVGDINGDRKT